ncbi:hypothetical protein CTAM01_17019 [Colletotrichum tamarilloi]|uniref:Uncharacterized protein n=1 Tax=Colletotrichum tamarilloi TaxID=1209934 RepID=A0ABQ9QGV6_9PEZI|nr:uncharacterized protein CTAM01_17019 [Colletotrichum tamarilloi]KAK1466474.1 hypothetical protein CTAM01_17019 [Colletotrichum tamarilloi]
MRSSSVLFVFAMALTGQACDTYKYCHCTNADGSANDGATTSACAAGDPIIYDRGYAECKHYDNYVYVVKAINNCDFRKACNAKGAAGDSSCRAKVGIGK